MTDPEAVKAAVADAHRRDWALVLAATARIAADLDLAQESVQEAYAAALDNWVRDGIPRNPAAWLTTTAKRRAMDALRRERTLRSKLPLLVPPETTGDTVTGGQAAGEPDPDDTVPDERLRLIFTCCHPALPADARVALTLRLMCGVSTPDIARTFLVSEATMAARITRAKRKISGAGIPYRVPDPAELPDRLRAVLDVIHLLFTTGHTAPSGAELVRGDLVDNSLRLARSLRELMPDEPEIRGLLALLLVTDARRGTRIDAAGRLLRLADQDRSRWDRSAIAEADALVVDGLRAGRPGRYLLQAAIAALYAQAPTYQQTDWPQALSLYDALFQVWPSPVVALNRTVPLAEVAGSEAALVALTELERDPRLGSYRYLPAIKADLLRRLGRPDDAAAAYRRALELTGNAAEQEFLADRLGSLRG